MQLYIINLIQFLHFFGQKEEQHNGKTSETSNEYEEDFGNDGLGNNSEHDSPAEQGKLHIYKYPCRNAF